MKSLISVYWALTATFSGMLVHGIASACDIPGGSVCESITPICRDPWDWDWQGLCCGSQEITGVCCNFYCWKKICNGTPVCGRVFTNSHTGWTCQSVGNPNGDMQCAPAP